MKLDRVVIASQNQKKRNELQQLLQPLGITVLSPADCGAADLEVEETGGTFEQNAVLKAVAFHKATGLPAVADDSGLSVDALNGEPGIFSARYGGPGLDDEQRLQLLLKNLQGVPVEQRGAHFTSSIALALPGGDGFVVTGECHGFITEQPLGEGGFGYDPVFFYAPESCTFGQLPPEVKNRVSHRAVAMRLLAEELERRLHDK